MNQKIQLKEKFINIHAHRQNKKSDEIVVRNFNTVDLTRFDPEIEQFASIGLHPWHIDVDTIYDDFNKIEKFLALPQIIAIGETGLDRTIHLSIEKQVIVFNKHLQWANQYKKPIIIHCVRAYYDLISVFNNNPVKVKAIIHGFNAKTDVALQLIKHDFYLSIGHRLFSRQSVLPDVVKNIPLEHLFIETDESDLNIEEIYNEVARIKDISVKNLIKSISNNFSKVFDV